MQMLDRSLSYRVRKRETPSVVECPGDVYTAFMETGKDHKNT